MLEGESIISLPECGENKALYETRQSFRDMEKPFGMTEILRSFVFLLCNTGIA